jgi:poly(beta-D-mannuronate) lyase
MGFRKRKKSTTRKLVQLGCFSILFASLLTSFFQVSTAMESTPKLQSYSLASGEASPSPSPTEVQFYASQASAVEATAPAPQIAVPLPPKEFPAQVLDLTHWKLTSPDGNETFQPKLNTRRGKSFRVTAAQDAVAFRAAVDGETTANSKYPRSELREMAGSGEASWTNKRGTHRMVLQQAITATPEKKPEVVAGQIHDDEDDVIMIRLEGNHLFVEADGEDVGTLDPNYVLGTRFKVVVEATPEGIFITYNNLKTVHYKKVADDLYFKAGCYTQSNTEQGDDPDAFGEVHIYKLKVSHEN